MTSDVYPIGWEPPAHSGDEPAARPPSSGPALWIPRAATVGLLGLTCWRAQQSHVLRGVAALTFPFFGTNEKERMAASHVVSNLVSPLLIWTVEGYRTTSAKTPLALPSLFGAGVQLLGVETVAPVYYLVSIFILPPETGASRRIDPDVASAVLPATLVGHVVPGILMSVLPLTATEVSRSYFTLQSIVCHVFYFSPIAVSVLTKGISLAIKSLRWLRGKSDAEAIVVEEKTTKQAQDVKDRPDLPALKTAYAAAFAYQSIQHILTGQLSSPGSLMSSPLTHLGLAGVSTSPMALYQLSTLTFGLYEAWDLVRRGYVTSREAKWAALSLVAGTYLVGPGAQYAGLWYWRESVINRRRRRHSLQ